jgi:type I restriction enzyme M protein
MIKNQHTLPEDLNKELQGILFNLRGFNQTFDSPFLGPYLLSILSNGSIIDVHNDNIKIDHSGELKKIDCSVHAFFEALLDQMALDQILLLSSLVKNLISKASSEELIIVFNELLSRVFDWTERGQLSNSNQIPGLINLIFELGNSNSNHKIYNPFCGTADFIHCLEPGQSYLGQDINKRSYYLGVLRSVLVDEYTNNSIHLLNSDPMIDWNPIDIKYDLILAVPPFNLRIEQQKTNVRGDVHFFRNAIQSIEMTGKVVALLPMSFLFSSDKQLLKLREDLVQLDLIELVLTLPSGALKNTSVQSCIVVLNNSKQRKGQVRFMDASTLIYVGDKKEIAFNPVPLFYQVLNSEDHSTYDDYGSLLSTWVENVNIKANEFNLTVGKYFVFEKYPNLPKTYLSEVAEVINSSRNKSESLGRLVRIGNLKKGLVDYTLKSSELNMIEIDQNARKIEEDCILMAGHFKQLKPTYFKYSGEPIYISPAIYALRIDKTKTDPFYLVHQLSTVATEFQIQGLSNGTAIPRISKKDLLSLKIEVPSLDEQERKITFLKEEYLLKNRESQEWLNEIKELQQKQKDDLRIKKHRLNQDMNNVASSARTLLNHLRSTGTLHIDQLINPNTGTTVLKRFESMLSSINNVLNQIDDLPNEMKFDEPETIDIEELVRWVIEQRPISEDDKYSLDLFIDKESFKYGDKEGEFITPYVDFSRNDFLELYNNIVENAILHGFIEDKNYTFKIEITGDLGGGRVSVLFGNNGKAFPDGMSERYSIKGEKAGVNANEGIGSWKVWSIAEHFNSKIKVHDLPNDEFPIWIELIIPLKTNWDV